MFVMVILFTGTLARSNADFVVVMMRTQSQRMIKLPKKGQENHYFQDCAFHPTFCEFEFSMSVYLQDNVIDRFRQYLNAKLSRISKKHPGESRLFPVREDVQWKQMSLYAVK